MSRHNDAYILDFDDKTPVPASYREWAYWIAKHQDKRIVAKTSLSDTTELFVSTVFLGIDHGFGGGPPLLFETMVFGGPLDQEYERYSTWDEAEQGHERMVAKTRGETS